LYLVLGITQDTIMNYVDFVEN